MMKEYKQIIEETIDKCYEGYEKLTYEKKVKILESSIEGGKWFVDDPDGEMKLSTSDKYDLEILVKLAESVIKESDSSGKGEG